MAGFDQGRHIFHLGISIVPTVASDDSGAVSRAIGYPASGTSRPQRGILIVAVDASFRGYRLNLSIGDRYFSLMAGAN